MPIEAVTLYGEKKLARFNGARVNGISRGYGLAVELAGCRNKFGDAKKRQLHTLMLGLRLKLHNHTLHFAARAARHPDRQRALAPCAESGCRAARAAKCRV